MGQDYKRLNPLKYSIQEGKKLDVTKRRLIPMVHKSFTYQNSINTYSSKENSLRPTVSITFGNSEDNRYQGLLDSGSTRTISDDITGYISRAYLAKSTTKEVRL